MSYLTFPSWIHPEIIPGIKVGTWYGLMYIFAFATTYLLLLFQIKKIKQSANVKELPINIEQKDNVNSLFTWAIIGLLLGARLFSVLIYAENRLYYWTHPWLIFWPFEGSQFVGLRGMSYHGGAIGAAVAVLIYTIKTKQNFLLWADLICAALPLGYTFGRLGNFINQELYGRVTSAPIGMLFNPPGMEKFLANKYPQAVEMANSLGIPPYGFINLPRHPSQLYEAFFEGIVLWALLWFVVRKLKRHNGQIFGAYLLGYGFFRFIIEYFRQPDSNLGYILNFTKKDFSQWDMASYHPIGAISMGQILCFIMILIGLTLILIAPLLSSKKDKPPTP